MKEELSVEKQLEKIDKLTAVIQKLLADKDKEWFGDKKNDNKSFDQYWDYVYDEKYQLDKLDRKRRMIMPYTLSEIPHYGDEMSLDEFIKACREGWFVDSDGSGYYGKDDKESNVRIYPSDISHRKVRREFNKVIWYNK